MWLLELVVVNLLLEGALLGLALLWCRATGRRLPAWIGPRWLVDRLNRWIDPDPRRFHRMMEIAGIPVRG